MASKTPPITVILDGRHQTINALQDVVTALQHSPIPCHSLLIVTPEATHNATKQVWHSDTAPFSVRWLTVSTLLNLSQMPTAWIGVIPKGATLPSTLPPLPSTPALMPWVTPVEIPQETAIEVKPPAIAWLMPTTLFAQVVVPFIALDDWTLLHIGRLLEQQQVCFQWHSASLHRSGIPASRSLLPPIRVLAIVPHFRCEVWLERCLRSLVNQTHPLDGIVVVDDGSAVPPLDLVAQFPPVTLFTAPTTVGPYRLVQQVIEMTSYDAYLFQDADDWSSCDRLETLLALMQATQAELVGTQEIRVYEEEGTITLGCYPLDVNAALAEKPGHPLLHPTSLVTRALVQRVGGFSTGLRFGGDTEFLLRAHWQATIVNSPHFCYFRRKRSQSLTTDPATGLDSPARQNLLRQVKQRALMHRAAVAHGQSPDLSPLAIAPPIALRHLAGPPLRTISDAGEG